MEGVAAVMKFELGVKVCAARRLVLSGNFIIWLSNTAFERSDFSYLHVLFILLRGEL